MGTVLLLLAGLLTMPGTAQADLTLIDADGIAAATSPSVNGAVNAIAPDGQGGMYIGGAFTTVNGAVRTGLAHIDAVGALGSWNPATPNGTITHLAVLGGSVYATGSFTSVGGVARAGTAAFSSSGTLLPWNPGGGGPLVSDGTNLYIGGGTVRAVNSAGTALWTQNVAATAMAVSGATLYIAGGFTSVATGASTSATRAGVAALSTATGYATTWAPTPDGEVTAIAVRGGAVHLGGSFTVVGTTTRLRLAAVDTTGALLPWNPAITSSSPSVRGLTALPNGVAVTGNFSEIAGTRRTGFAVIDGDGAMTTPAAYAGSGTSTATAVGSRLAIGTTSSGTVQTRPDPPTIASISVNGLSTSVSITGAARSGNQSPRFLVTCSGPGGPTTGGGSTLFPVLLNLKPGTHSCVAVQASEPSSGLPDSAPSTARDVTVTGNSNLTAPTSFERTLTLLGRGSLEISLCSKRRDPATCDAVRTCTSTCTHTFTKSASAGTGGYWILRSVPRPGFAVASLGFFPIEDDAKADDAPPRRRSRCPWNLATTGRDPLSCFVSHSQLYSQTFPGKRRFAVAFEATAKAFGKPSSVAAFKASRPGVSTLAWTATIQSFAIPLVRTLSVSCLSTSGSQATRTVPFRKPTGGRIASDNATVRIAVGGLSAGTTYACLFNVKATGLKDVAFKTTTGTLGGGSGGSSGGGSGGGSSGAGSAPVRPVIGPIIL